MKIRVLGGGWYGCHIARTLLEERHDVELHEIAGHLFAGASGNNQSRLHQGFHYPRDKATRDSCRDGVRQFMECYGELTQVVPTNIYAIAENASMIDFGTYLQVLRESEIEFITIDRPADWGLARCEGAVLTGERLIRGDHARSFFTETLGDIVKLKTSPEMSSPSEFDLTIDCTFSALNDRDVGRYEPCIMFILSGPDDRAITIMDGPFCSIYTHRPGRVTLTASQITAMARCRSYKAAQDIIEGLNVKKVHEIYSQMADLTNKYVSGFYRDYNQVGYVTAIRALPDSAADRRLCSVERDGDTITIMPGKMDAIFYAAEQVGLLI